MEWIRISQNKLKIMLSAQDTAHYALDCKKADGSDEGSRAAFREILSDVQRETGFEAAEDKVYIQMYPSKEGGCELFVTKIGLLFGEDKPMNTNSAQKATKRPRPTQKRSAAFLFPDFSCLLSACKGLHVHFSTQLPHDPQGQVSVY